MDMRKFKGKEFEREILRFLKRNVEKSFNVKQIQEGIKRGYPATLKYIDLLEAKGLIEIEDFGNVKIVKLKEGKGSGA